MFSSIACCGAGSGGRIAIYATAAYSYSGTLRAFGGSGPSTSSNGAPGTVYLQTGFGGSLFRKLIVDNNGLSTSEGVRASLNDKALLGSGVFYYLDELRLLRAAQFGLVPGDSVQSIRTILSIQTLSGDGSGILQTPAYTQINIITASGVSTLLYQSSFISTPLLNARSSTTNTVVFISGSALLNTSSIYVYSGSCLVLPSSVTVSNVLLRVDGDLFGIRFLTISGSGSVDIRSTARSSTSYVKNMFRVSSVYLQNSGSLLLTHDKTELQMLIFLADTSVQLVGNSRITVIGSAQIQTPVLSVNTSCTISANGNGYAPTSTNTLCPQTGGGQPGASFGN